MNEQIVDAYLAWLDEQIVNAHMGYIEPSLFADQDSVSHWRSTYKAYLAAKEAYLELRDKATSGQDAS